MVESSIEKESFEAEEPSPWKPWLIASIAAFAILGIALLLMHFLGLFKITGDETGTKTLAAALALVGSVLASVLTLVGTVVKYSIDDRNSRLASIEASRNHSLALEAEKRNRIEAAIRAVDLLCENNKDTTENQIGGAILALVSLGELDLAVTLLAQLWPNSLKSPHVAGVVLEEVLKSGSESAQISAAALLAQNGEHIGHAGFHIWPFPDMRWRTDLPGNCRISLVRAAGRWLMTEIAEHKEHLPHSSVVLYQALSDPDDLIRDIAQGILWPLVPVFPEPAWVYYGNNIRVSIEDIAGRFEQFPFERLTQDAIDFESEIQELLAPKAGDNDAPDSDD